MREVMAHSTIKPPFEWIHLPTFDRRAYITLLVERFKDDDRLFIMLNEECAEDVWKSGKVRSLLVERLNDPKWLKNTMINPNRILRYEVVFGTSCVTEYVLNLHRIYNQIISVLSNPDANRDEKILALISNPNFNPHYEGTLVLLFRYAPASMIDEVLNDKIFDVSQQQNAILKAACLRGDLAIFEKIMNHDNFHFGRHRYRNERDEVVDVLRDCQNDEPMESILFYLSDHPKFGESEKLKVATEERRRLKARKTLNQDKAGEMEVDEMDVDMSQCQNWSEERWQDYLNSDDGWECGDVFRWAPEWVIDVILDNDEMDVNQSDQGSRPLETASSRGNLLIVKKIVAHPMFDLDSAPNAVLVALDAGHSEIVSFLLDEVLNERQRAIILKCISYCDEEKTYARKERC